MSTKENKKIYEGLITASLPNGMFWVRLYNEDGDLIIGYISGKMRLSFIKVITGDKVKIEVSSYDCSRGRIIYRFTNNYS